MERKPETKYSRWIITIIALSLMVLWSFGGPWVASADDPGAICVMRLASNTTPILSVIVDQPNDFNIAISTPARKVIKVPVRCDMLETLALGVANQGDSTNETNCKSLHLCWPRILLQGPLPIGGSWIAGGDFQ